MRGKGDSSAGSVCNFLASTRAATVSSSALSRSDGVVRPVRVLRPKQVCADGPQGSPRVFVRAQRLGAGAGDIGSRRCVCRAPAWDAPVSLMLVSSNQQSRSYCRSGDEAGACARRACRQSSDSDEGMADGSVEVPNGSACLGSFDRLRSASSCAAPTERSPGARPRRREPRNGCRDARHDQQRAAL